MITSRHRPERTCIGCRGKAAVSELVRLAIVDGSVVLDHEKNLPGRGAWLHAEPDCFRQAVRRRAIVPALMAKGSARRQLTVDPEQLASSFASAAEGSDNDR